MSVTDNSLLTTALTTLIAFLWRFIKIANYPCFQRSSTPEQRSGSWNFPPNYRTPCWQTLQVDSLPAEPQGKPQLQFFYAYPSGSHPYWARETLLSMAPVISTWYSMVNSQSSNTWPIYCCSVAQSCLTLYDPEDCYTPGFPILHCFLNLLICICCQSHPPTNINSSLDFHNM